jgi:MAP/microtubule affinity-regulating kinase/calcium-dependent protein kinase
MQYNISIVKIYFIESKLFLKPSLKLCNFYLDENNNVKLGDFGFACQLANSADKKRETCGTPNYIAP